MIDTSYCEFIADLRLSHVYYAVNIREHAAMAGH